MPKNERLEKRKKMEIVKKSQKGKQNKHWKSESKKGEKRIETKNRDRLPNASSDQINIANEGEKRNEEPRKTQKMMMVLKMFAK